MNETPHITIVTASYNCENFIEESICSVLDQTYPKTQYIIIDGGSTDGTVGILERYRSSIDVVVSERDEGIYDAWNKAIRLAKGDWICFIGADDFFSRNTVLEEVAAQLITAEEKGLRYAYGRVNLINPGSKESIELLGDDWNVVAKGIRKNMCLAHCGSFHHKSLFEDHGHFDSKFKIAGDYEFLLREFSDAGRKGFFMGDLTVVQMRGGGISGDLETRLTLAKECQAARKKHGITEFSFELFFWLARIRVMLILGKLIGRKAMWWLADTYRWLRGKRNRWQTSTH